MTGIIEKEHQEKTEYLWNNIQEQIDFVASSVCWQGIQNSLRQFLTPALFYHRRQTDRPNILRIELCAKTENLLKEHWKWRDRDSVESENLPGRVGFGVIKRRYSFRLSVRDGTWSVPAGFWGLAKFDNGKNHFEFETTGLLN